ncbi:triose-phosphate isomerase [Pseudobacteriovorax antillogorgiicola]|uniref:Triosephosphate isomerase n=1 Tax=Pseudobacteriovorax antillogorgiicola TaxID=1513793 RepID=A0A1Y6B3X8_9BACT|nr:triose-phosphate isomerase [Pseudobacteriovorax antillogorgiicola]TCS59224.1 triosephosphate isomerase [Pseudobacteriovorax antillogorgiicola]SME90378.1 triosephosphate isomerase [Pseudobacteriovorax antillogorgiicola]
MARKPLMAGNWKMNKLPSEAADFFPEFLELSKWQKEQVDVVFAVPATHLDRLLDIGEESGISFAPQNVHWESAGAFTGEISIPMIQDLGLNYALVGHSERRQYFAETDETVANKVGTLLSAKMTPIICVGETQVERESDKTVEVITRQIKSFASKLTGGDFVVAYEPVWAIGTGLTASQEQAQDVHALIRRLLKEEIGEQADTVRILYGGSAKPANISGLLAQDDIDGALVGGASLKPADFAAMVQAAMK